MSSEVSIVEAVWNLVTKLHFLFQQTEGEFFHSLSKHFMQRLAFFHPKSSVGFIYCW